MPRLRDLFYISIFMAQREGEMLIDYAARLHPNSTMARHFGLIYPVTIYIVQENTPPKIKFFRPVQEEREEDFLLAPDCRAAKFMSEDDIDPLRLPHLYFEPVVPDILSTVFLDRIATYPHPEHRCSLSVSFMDNIE